MERTRKDGLPKKLDRGCCLPIGLFGLHGSQLRIKDASKQVQHEASSCIGSYRHNRNGDVSKGTDEHVTNGNGVRTVVFPTSVSLVEPDAVGFDLHTPGLVSDAKPATSFSGQEVYRQMLYKTRPSSDTSVGTASVTESDSPHGGHVLVVALADANVGMEVDHQSVASSTLGETAEEMEARVRREVETQIRQEMEAPPHLKHPAATRDSLRLRSLLERHPHFLRSRPPFRPSSPSRLVFPSALPCYRSPAHARAPALVAG